MTSADRSVRLTVTARTSLGSSAVEVEVPVGRCDPRHLLPALRTIDDVLIAHAQAASERSGKSITCREGCGVCCHQLVPIVPIEARWLADYVESLPEDRRVIARSRFTDAIRQLTESDLLDRVMAAGTLAGRPLRRLAAEYFHLRIPCPFLDEGSCSIYPVRPLACREYLVTSPAEACAGKGQVDRIPVPGRLSRRLERDEEGRAVWVPLVLAPRWVAANPETAPTKGSPTGPAQLAALLTANPTGVPGAD